MDKAGATAQKRCDYIHLSSVSSIPAIEGLHNGASFILKALSQTLSSSDIQLILRRSKSPFLSRHAGL